MSTPWLERFAAAAVECERHMAVLASALRDLRTHLPISADALQAANPSLTLLLDQALYRFTKLQDAMGLRLVPATLAVLQEPFEDRPMLDKLNQLEKIGLLPSVDQWQTFRQLRNAVAHEYPDRPAHQAQLINAALDAAQHTSDWCRNWLQQVREKTR